MTKKEFSKLKWEICSHMALTDKHISCCNCKSIPELKVQSVTYAMDGRPYGQAYNDYMFQGIIYKTENDLLAAITEWEEQNNFADSEISCNFAL